MKREKAFKLRWSPVASQYLTLIPDTNQAKAIGQQTRWMQSTEYHIIEQKQAT